MASLSADGINPATYKPATPPPDHDADPGPKFAPASPFDPTFTDRVINATGKDIDPRLAFMMPIFLRHMHDAARESGMTMADFHMLVDFINRCGQASTDTRNETQLVLDILGVESIADENTSKLLAGKGRKGEGLGSQRQMPTPSCVLGPFHRENAPLLPNGSSIVKIPENPTTDRWTTDSTFLSGKVVSARTGRPIPGAIVDIWHTGPNGLYEQQDPDQEDMNLRGRFVTDEDGRYSLYCLRPVAYPVPMDGPAGELLTALDRTAMRPAHIHFLIEKPGYGTLVTQVFDREDEYLNKDSVFAVKPELVVDYQERMGDPKARLELEYDFALDELDEDDE